MRHTEVSRILQAGAEEAGAQGVSDSDPRMLVPHRSHLQVPQRQAGPVRSLSLPGQPSGSRQGVAELS